MNKISWLLFCCAVVSCHRNDGNISSISERHEEKLRRHFTGQSTEDVSTLIQETKGIACRLRKAHMCTDANRFDSYTDVLVYGNKTIDESINDVMNLVRANHCSLSTKCNRCFK
ncbi:MAG: hypothetical protein LBF57_02900 [Holosporaceae bacterium]|jgi:hypothetical protein|nr:hypothetical protein [Holosporaceae bacterium]